MKRNRKMIFLVSFLAVVFVLVIAMTIGVFMMGRVSGKSSVEASTVKKEKSDTEKEEQYESVDLKDFSVSSNSDNKSKKEEESGSAALEDKNAYLLPDSATKNIAEEDLKDLTPKELTYARNEIYARHGRVFESDELNKYFQTKSWYKADDSFDDASLSKVESGNAEIILKYQADNNLKYEPQ